VFSTPKSRRNRDWAQRFPSGGVRHEAGSRWKKGTSLTCGLELVVAQGAGKSGLRGVAVGLPSWPTKRERAPTRARLCRAGGVKKQAKASYWAAGGVRPSGPKARESEKER
jgi:hypothetical protein